MGPSGGEAPKGCPSRRGVAGWERLGDTTADPRIIRSAESVLTFLDPRGGGVAGTGLSDQGLAITDVVSVRSEFGVPSASVKYSEGTLLLLVPGDTRSSEMAVPARSCLLDRRESAT
jgi:hypothetical protein